VRAYKDSLILLSTSIKAQQTNLAESERIEAHLWSEEAQKFQPEAQKFAGHAFFRSYEADSATLGVEII